MEEKMSMGVYIRGIEMPKSCIECPFITSSWGLDYYCTIAKDYEEYRYINERRMKSCPLVSVPPHGRLIDADALMSGVDDGDDVIFVWAITDAPTIIEAEEDE